MRIDILTLFPEMFSAMSESILGRAQKDGKIDIRIVNIRDYTEDKHLKCDDYPFGGGAGMVMMPQPIGSAIEAIDPEHKARRIYMSPKGETLRQQKVFELINYEHLVLLCGHYEGTNRQRRQVLCRNLCVTDRRGRRSLQIVIFLMRRSLMQALFCYCNVKYVNSRSAKNSASRL